jgi:type I restriction enzyme, R subunit
LLATIARDLVLQVQANLKRNWISREPVRARLRATIKRLLACYNYPPDQEAKAIDLVIRQMEHFADIWSKDGRVG